MIYQANKRQFGALEGLAHWCAEYYYTLERFGADDAEYARDPQGYVFLHGSVRCAGRAILGAKRRPCMGRELEGQQAEYFDAAMARRGITCSGAEG